MRISAAARTSMLEVTEDGVEGGAGGSEDVVAVVELSHCSSGTFSCHESMEDEVSSSSGM